MASDGTPPGEAIRVIGDITMRLRKETPRTVSGRKIGRSAIVIVGPVAVWLSWFGSTIAKSPSAEPAARQDVLWPCLTFAGPTFQKHITR